MSKPQENERERDVFYADNMPIEENQMDHKKESGQVELEISVDTSEVDGAIEKVNWLRKLMEEAEKARWVMNAGYINENLLPIISIVISLLAIIRTI